MYYYNGDRMLEMILIIVIVFSYIFSVIAFTRLANEKGHEDKTGKVVALAILGTPILAALYVAALPDKKLVELLESARSAVSNIDADKSSS